MARALIADPDLPRKVLRRPRDEIRPCVACNEDCRTFDPVLLCTVNPDLAPPGEPRRPAAPLDLAGGLDASAAAASRSSAPARRASSARSAWLAPAAARSWSSRPPIASAGSSRLRPRAQPRRLGAAARLLRARARPRGRRAAPRQRRRRRWTSSTRSSSRPAPRRSCRPAAGVVGGHRGRTAGAAGGAHLVVVDDGFGWWPAINAVELGGGGRAEVTLVTPGTAFAGHPGREPGAAPPAPGGRRRAPRHPAGVGDGEPLGRDARRRRPAPSAGDRGRRVVVVGERRPRATPRAPRRSCSPSATRSSLAGPRTRSPRAGPPPRASRRRARCRSSSADLLLGANARVPSSSSGVLPLLST